MTRVVKLRLEGTGELQPDGSMRVIGVLQTLDVALPALPVNVEVTEITEAKASFRWTDAGDASSWRVYRYETEGGSETSSLLVTVLVPEVTDETVEADTSYTYEIEAVNQAGASERESITVETAAVSGPAAPSEFETFTVTATRLYFGWAAEAGVVDWQVYRDDSLVATVTSPEYDNTGLTPSTEYTFNVVARNSSGDSAQSDDYVLTTDANAAPVWAAVEEQAATVGDSYSLDLTQLCIDPDGQPVTFEVVSSDVPGIALSGDEKFLVGTFTTAGDYSATVRGSDGIDTADLEISFAIAEVADTTGPTAPVISVEASGSTAIVSLVTPSTDASGVKNYQIHRSIDGGSTYALRITKNEDELPFSDTGLANGAKYYKVRARDLSSNANLGEFSDAKVVTINVQAPQPDTPTLQAVALDSTTIQLTWTPGASGAPPDDYDGDFSTAGDTGPWTALTIGLQESFTHTGRTPGQQVFYRLKAKAGASESAYATASATPSASSSRVVYAETTFQGGDLEQQPTARTQESRRKGSGIYIQAVERNQGSGYGVLRTTNPGTSFTGVNSDYDVRVLQSISITGNSLTDNVTPREGPNAWFLHTQCFRGKSPNDGNTMGGTTKHYEVLNGSPAGTHNAAKCKPRTAFSYGNDQAYGFPYDTRIRLGFSWYIPRSYENDSKKKGQTGNGPQLMPLNLSNSNESTQFSLHVLVPTAAAGWKLPNGQPVPATDDNYWCLIWERNPTTYLQGSQGGTGQTTKIALAPLLPHTDPDSDRGKWTDFVFDFCINPFTSATTVAGWNFRANTGRLQIYKSTGPVLADGNRFISESQPLYSVTSGGVGLRPRDATSMPTADIRQYCFGVRPEAATDRTHPIEMCYAAGRWGFVENRTHARSEDSNLVTAWQGGVPTSFADVLPRKA